jgi:hypothetical protein
LTGIRSLALFRFMADESEQPSKPKDQTEHHKAHPPGLVETVKKSISEGVLDDRPWLKPWIRFYKGLKREYRLVLICIGIAVVCVYGTHHFDSDHYDSDLSDTNTFWFSTNTFLLGEVSGVTEQFESYKHDAENQILNLNEDNSKLTAELGNANLRIDQLETIPLSALETYSNIDREFALVNLVYSNQTQSTSGGRPVFLEFGKRIAKFGTKYGAVDYSNPTEIYIETNRLIEMDMIEPWPNAKSITDLMVTIELTLNITNIASGIGGTNGWQFVGSMPGNITLTAISDKILTGDNSVDFPPILVSTNYQDTNIFTFVTFTAPGQIVQHSFFELLMPNNIYWQDPSQSP